MRDIGVELTRGGRIRYAVVRAFVSLCVGVFFAVLLLVLIDDTRAGFRGERIHLRDVFWELVGLPFCTIFFCSLVWGWVWRYPVFRACRLEIHWGTVSLVGRGGAVLGEIKRAAADRTRDRLIWFRNKSKTSDAFDFPLYLVAEPRRNELLAAVGLAPLPGDDKQRL
ncbi:MAG TPA: hypothetical protein VGI81_10930 [Tepidisphaeraceae bacterium]|jgi:hypothetical protein